MECDECGKTFHPSDGVCEKDNYLCGECVARRVELADPVQRPSGTLPPHDKKGSS
jgi:hypothetical protein